MKRVIGFTVVLLLAACAPMPKQQEPQRSAQQYRDTIVVNSDANFSLMAQQTVCDHPVLAAALRNPQLSDLRVYDQMHQALVAGFVARGVHYQSTADQVCDYWFAFAIPSSQQLSDQQLMSLFGISPGLADNSNQDFQRATLNMSLYQPQSSQAVWQLSMQAFAQVAQDQQGRRQLVLKPQGLDYVVQRVFSHLQVQAVQP